MTMQDDKSTVQKVNQISKRIFWSSILIFCISALLGIPLQILELRWRWFDVFGGALIAVAMMLLVISWVTPGILIILGVPKLTHAWLRGINPVAIRNKPWEELSDIEKVLIYFWAILLSAFTLLAIIGSVHENMRK
jgi:ABC-type microcin C transport system permease subunit YejB